MPDKAVVHDSPIFSILNPKHSIQVSLDGQTVPAALVKFAYMPLAEGQFGPRRDNPNKMVPASTWNYWRFMSLRNGHHQAYTKHNLSVPQYAVVVREIGEYAGAKLVLWCGKFTTSQEELDACPVVATLTGEQDGGVYRVGDVSAVETPLVAALPADLRVEDLPEIEVPVEEVAYTGDAFTIDATGHFIGDDGFRVPRDFAEFCEWNPKYIENWVKRRLSRGAVDMDVEDWTQDLSIHMHWLPATSKHRLPGANGRVDGCKDVVETFNPIRQYGASERRFRHYINNCLANRFSTIQSKRQKNPICRMGNLSLASAMDPENYEVVDDEYVHGHSEILTRQSRSRLRQEEQAVFLSEFKTFVMEEDPDMLRVAHAIESTGTFGEAMRDLGMSEQEFSRARNRLKQLAACFQEDQVVPKQRKPYKKRGATV
jgi:hypothetical protein